MLLNGRIYVALGGIKSAASTSTVNEAYFTE